MKEKLKVFSNGLLKENPSLRLVLGTCPTLAVTTLAVNGLGMGLAATFVLVCSNIAISALRKIIPDKVRLPAYITVIATFVTVLQMLVKAFVPALDSALGIFLPLIVVTASSWAVPRCSLPRTASAFRRWTAWAWVWALRELWW